MKRNYKQKRLEYLDGTPISNGRQNKVPNKETVIHLYLHRKMTRNLSNLDVPIRKMKFFIVMAIFVVLEDMIFLYWMIAILTVKVILN